MQKMAVNYDCIKISHLSVFLAKIKLSVKQKACLLAPLNSFCSSKYPHAIEGILHDS
jgi:hypothetical protein